MNLLCTTADDEDRYLSWFKHAGREYIDVPNVKYAAIRFEAGSSVLLGQGRVNLVLRGREPELEGFGVTFYVGVQNFRENVFAHIAEEGFDLEGRVHFTEFFDDSSRFVLGEEASHAICDAAGCGHKRVFGLVVSRFKGEEGLHDSVGIFEVCPCLVEFRIFVQSNVGSSTKNGVSDICIIYILTYDSLLWIFLHLLHPLAGRSLRISRFP